jgi:HSP20 family molecular chaperone IbpA
MLTLFSHYNSRDFPSIFDLVDDLLSPSPYLETSCYNNPISYKRRDKGVTIEVLVPGYGKEDLELSFEKNTLCLTNKVEEGSKSTDRTISYKILMPKDIDEKSIKTKCDKGLLSIDAEYIKPQKGRTIKIN